jgi:hypothetical protein
LEKTAINDKNKAMDDRRILLMGYIIFDIKGKICTDSTKRWDND